MVLQQCGHLFLDYTHKKTGRNAELTRIIGTEITLRMVKHSMMTEVNVNCSQNGHHRKTC